MKLGNSTKLDVSLILEKSIRNGYNLLSEVNDEIFNTIIKHTWDNVRLQTNIILTLR